MNIEIVSDLLTSHSSINSRLINDCPVEISLKIKNKKSSVSDCRYNVGWVELVIFGHTKLLV